MTRRRLGTSSVSSRVSEIIRMPCGTYSTSRSTSSFQRPAGSLAFPPWPAAAASASASRRSVAMSASVV